MKFGPAPPTACENSADFHAERRLTPDRLAGPGELPRRAGLRLGRGGPLDEEPRGLLLLFRQGRVDGKAPVPDRGDALAVGPARPARKADLADHLGLFRVHQHRRRRMRVDVGGHRALRERVGDVGPVPVANGRRRVGRERVHVPVERVHRLGRVDDDVLALEPLAAETAEDRRVDVHVLPRAREAAQRQPVDAVGRVVQRLRVGEQLVIRIGRVQALGVVQVLAIDLHRHLAIVGNAVGLAVHRIGIAPGLEDVVVVVPGGVGQRGVVQVLVQRFDPLVGDVQRVIHRVGRVRGVRGGPGRQVEHRLLADLAGRHLLGAHLHAGECLELRQQPEQVVEVAGRNDRDRDRLALHLLPVDLGAAVGRQIVPLREGAGHPVRGGRERAHRSGLLDGAAAAGLLWIVRGTVGHRCLLLGWMYSITSAIVL